MAVAQTDPDARVAQAPRIVSPPDRSPLPRRIAWVLAVLAVLAVGTQLTATATLGGSTSEFSGSVPVTAGIGGTVFEVPPHLRGRTVRLHYQVLRPEVLWLEDGGTRVPVRELDAVANSRRPRIVKTEPPATPKTMLLRCPRARRCSLTMRSLSAMLAYPDPGRQELAV